MIQHTFSEFISNNTHTFRELLPNKSKHIFRVHIKYYWHFQGVTSKQYYTLTLPDIKQYWHFQKVTGKQYYKLFQISYHYQTILTFSESYWETILHTFPKFISSNTDNFRELLPNYTILKTFFRVHITQHWHFQRITSKQYWLV